MTPELSQKLSAAMDRMPAFPKSVQRILELTRDVNCSPKDLMQVIDKDPVITLKILKVVNSPFYGLPRQITAINHALVFMGFNTVKNLALSIAAIGMLPRESTAGFDAQQYLLHSLATAGIAKLLGTRKVDDADPADCFIAGLLHDFGKVLLAQHMPAEYEAAVAQSQATGTSLHRLLAESIGTDHAEVGALLVEKWRFAPVLVETIRSQHGPQAQDTDLVACVFGANQISKKLRFGSGGNGLVEALPPQVARRLGGGLDEVIASLGDLDTVFEEAKVFARA
jgi:putative nucleotidyltransferase with HDIG domain